MARGTRPWRRLGLRARTSIALGGISVAVAGVLCAFTFERAKHEVLGSRVEAAEREAFANARIARSRLRSLRPTVEVVDALARGGAVSLLRVDGEWFVSNVAIDDGDLPDPLVAEVVQGTSARQRVAVDGELRLITGVPIASEGAQYFEVAAIDDVNDVLAQLRRTLIIGLVGAGALGASLGAVASRRVLRPLRDVAAAARTVRSGQLEATLEDPHDPDLDDIVEEFNSMVRELRERIERDERFTSDVTHELRGPLATLQASIDLAERHVDDQARRQHALDALRSTVAGFNRLVTDLLEISRIEAGVVHLRLEPSDLRELLRALLRSADAQLEPIVEPGAKVHVSVDRRRLAQVIINLVENARHYAGGACAIRITPGESGDSVRIVVEDEGPGVPAHERRAIFERFHRGSTGTNVAGGSGLGLALAAEHVALHHGALWVEDRPGGGARFIIEIPTDETS